MSRVLTLTAPYLCHRLKSAPVDRALPPLPQGCQSHRPLLHRGERPWASPAQPLIDAKVLFALEGRPASVGGGFCNLHTSRRERFSPWHQRPRRCRYRDMPFASSSTSPPHHGPHPWVYLDLSSTVAVRETLDIDKRNRRPALTVHRFDLA